MGARSRKFFVLLLLPVLSWADSESNTVTLVPKGRPFPITFADPREIRTAALFSGSNFIQAYVGSYQSLFSVQSPDSSWDVHFGLEGRGYFVMRQEGARFPLDTVDGTIGLYVEGSRGPWHWQVRYTHVSAHLADGSTDTPILYSRETLSLRGGWAPNERLHVYLGLHHLLHTIPKLDTLAAQVGVSAFIPLGKTVSPFVAADLRWAQETPVNPSFNLQLGVGLHEPGAGRGAFRLFYTYFTGADVRGQYFLDTRTIHSFGIEMPL